MSILKYYNSATSQWEPAMVAGQGPQGIQGIQGTNGALSPNYIINGGFDIWQRGTSLSVGIGIPYTADRWQVIRGSGTAGMTVSRQATGLTSFQYGLRAQRDSGDTNTTAGLQVFQSIESVESIKLAGKTVTFSFYARAGANFSSSGSALNFALKTGTSTDANVRVGGFGGSATDITNTNFTLTASWVRYTATATVPNNSTQLGFIFSYTPTGIAGANDWFEITGVQLEEGSTATAFRRNSPNIQAELAACQRYYYRISVDSGGIGYPLYGYGVCGSATIVDYTINLPVTMRATLSLDASGIAVYDFQNIQSSGSWVLTYENRHGPVIRYTHGSAVFTSARPAGIVKSGASVGYLGINGEL